MGRPYAPHGDQMQERLTNAAVDVALALWELKQTTAWASDPEHFDEVMDLLISAQANLTAAEAIRKQLSPRRVAALEREALKREESVRYDRHSTLVPAIP